MTDLRELKREHERAHRIIDVVTIAGIAIGIVLGLALGMGAVHMIETAPSAQSERKQ
ncbi:hypothetical protein [Roseovarius sp. D0-M9]|uniref:hypothetical protein n=1 Tax=Roseovarius sp. D0-M9 TaxID=3127117 RepID=UPI00300FBC7D